MECRFPNGAYNIEGTENVPQEKIRMKVIRIFGCTQMALVYDSRFQAFQNSVGEPSLADIH